VVNFTPVRRRSGAIAGILARERTKEENMEKWMTSVKDRVLALHRDEEGQDLIEYALIAALIALAAVVGMGVLANAINEAFSGIGSILNSYIT
jgi:pilus assembly protein Flp/PilA